MIRPASEAAFTLIELVMATAIMVIATAAVFTVMNPSRGIFRAQPEVYDLQQRLRVAVDMLQKDLIMAGAGMYMGPSTGALNRYVAPVLPYRAGDSGADAPSGIFYKPDAVSVIYVPPTAAQAIVLKAVLSGATLSVQAELNCGPGPRDRVCGFAPGTRVLVFDQRGHSEIGTVTSVDGQTIVLQGSGLHGTVDPGSGAVVTEIAQHTYSMSVDAATGTSRLMHYDGRFTNLPVADHVISLHFEYFGDPRPPMLLPGAVLTDSKGPWTTYGLKPPPAGENCTFAVSEASHVPRLASLGEGGSPIALDPGMLTDGPWCPDPSNPDRFDADLLRIRRIRVTLRVQAADASFRGPAGPLFMHGGSATSSQQLVPDQEIRFDVTPRNLNLER